MLRAGAAIGVGILVATGGGPGASSGASAEPLRLVLATSVAAAEPARLEDRWPAVPAGRALSLEDQLTDKLTELGNLLGKHLELLSHDTFQLTTNCRLRRAHLRIGAGSPDTFGFHVDGQVHFDDLNANIRARLELDIKGHAFRLELPAVELSPAHARGDYGVSIQLPLIARSF